MSKKKGKKKNSWKIPKNATKYFDPHYDDAFKAEHPVLYWLTVVAIIVCVLVGPSIYLLFCSYIQSTFNEQFFELIVWIVGFVSSFGISIGICNLLMFLHKQYLGHYVTLISFAIGIAGSSLSLLLLWLI